MQNENLKNIPLKSRERIRQPESPVVSVPPGLKSSIPAGAGGVGEMSAQGLSSWRKLGQRLRNVDKAGSEWMGWGWGMGGGPGDASQTSAPAAGASRGTGDIQGWKELFRVLRSYGTHPSSSALCVAS